MSLYKAAILALSGILFVAAPTADGGADERAASPAIAGRLQQALDAYLAERGEVEHFSGLALHVSLGDPGPIIEAFAGTVSRDDGAAPVSPDTLFQIGSNTKAFTAAVLLKLEAEGVLSIEQTVGDWLPQYPAWQDVTIRQLLDMTSPIPNYSEAPAMSRAEARDIHRQWAPEELVAFVYPDGHDRFPPGTGFSYSNTNYILAGMIIAAATKSTYEEALRRLILDELDGRYALRDTYYSSGPYPEAVLSRAASGYFFNPDCGEYEPDCERSDLAPLIGRDMRTNNMSWAGPAGGIIGSPRDIARWVRALYGGRVLPPQQQKELMSIVSHKTGAPIAETTPDDPLGFGLGVGQAFKPELGRFWYYEGETLGYRMIYAWVPHADVVIALAANSQPAAAEDRLGDLVSEIYGILRETGSITAAPR